MKVLVLGAGLVGKPMAIDLASDNEMDVTVADINAELLEQLKNNYPVQVMHADLSDPATVRSMLAPFDIVLDAVPGFMGFRTFKAIIEAGKPVVDIAFFPEDPMVLDALALEKGVTAIMDMGVAPGMSNVLTGYAHSLLDSTESAFTYVGGLPLVRQWPYEYKAVFSPVDVIEEYTRPARLVRNGECIVMPALSEPELMNFPGIGTLEAFNSDGLRSLAYTIPARNMAEKTLRYPGHIRIMEILRETGFFSQEEILLNGQKIRPMDITAKLLFPKWKLEEGEEDLTVMKIIVEGLKNEKRLRYTFDLFDRYDKGSATHSMARTTGYTATAAVRMLAKGLFQRKGVIVPEYIGMDHASTRFLLDELKGRGVVYTESVTEL